MKINVQNEITRAHNKYIHEKIGKDDSSITYQEFALYWILRMCASLDFIDIDECYSNFKNDGWIDKEWQKTTASRFNDMVIDKPWDRVFDY